MNWLMLLLVHLRHLWRHPSSLALVLCDFFVVLLITLSVSAQLKQASASRSTAPHVFLLNAQMLQDTKTRIASGETSLHPALVKLESDAQKALTTGSFSVVTKDLTPPSGDKHDYMSQAPYFWPDPKSPNRLPYIRRDGERNPEINKISDHRNLDQMVGATETLALSYYFTGNELHAAKAVQLLRVFFLEAPTRMNPNLQFAQGIPGVNTGRGIGLIETRGLTKVVDSIGLLEGSHALTTEDRQQLHEWFARFLQWMLESKNGRDESAAKNNHGTYYDLQVVSFALFLNKRELAENILRTAREKRIAVQIEPDGRQPLELARTRAWSYSIANLDGLMQLATLGDRVGVDLWNYKTADGRSIKAALNYLLPFALGEQKFPYQQLGEWSPQSLFPLVRLAARKYRDSEHQTILQRLPPVELADRELLAPS